MNPQLNKYNDKNSNKNRINKRSKKIYNRDDDYL
jgi:hypothetical protein